MLNGGYVLFYLFEVDILKEVDINENIYAQNFVFSRLKSISKPKPVFLEN